MLQILLLWFLGEAGVEDVSGLEEGATLHAGLHDCDGGYGVLDEDLVPEHESGVGLGQPDQTLQQPDRRPRLVPLARFAVTPGVKRHCQLIYYIYDNRFGSLTHIIINGHPGTKLLISLLLQLPYN